MQHSDSPGQLTLVATPLGNLGDLSPRAVADLQSADLVLAEDTRTFRKLGERFDIRTAVMSFHDHNEMHLTPRLIERMRGGARIALVSEAGTPVVSDPGFRLVRACREQGIPVSTVPGPCAAVAALSISGLEAHRFTFEGFLPVKSAKRRSVLGAALDRSGATVFYESPHRVRSTLELLCELDGEREIFLVRELTKLHEECFTGRPGEVLSRLPQRVRGEIVLVVRGDVRRDAHRAS